MRLFKKIASSLSLIILGICLSGLAGLIPYFDLAPVKVAVGLAMLAVFFVTADFSKTLDEKKREHDHNEIDTQLLKQELKKEEIKAAIRKIKAGQGSVP